MKRINLGMVFVITSLICYLFATVIFFCNGLNGTGVSAICCGLICMCLAQYLDVRNM